MALYRKIYSSITKAKFAKGETIFLLSQFDIKREVSSLRR